MFRHCVETIPYSSTLHPSWRDCACGHAGVFNEPLADLMKVLASLVDADNRILVPGFHDLVRPNTLEPALQRLSASSEFSLDGYRAALGIPRLVITEPMEPCSSPSSAATRHSSCDDVQIPMTCQAHTCCKNDCLLRGKTCSALSPADHAAACWHHSMHDQ